MEIKTIPQGISIAPEQVGEFSKDFLGWAIKKQELDSIPNSPRDKYAKINQIWWYWGGVGIGQEICGWDPNPTRPCLILSVLPGGYFVVPMTLGISIPGSVTHKITSTSKIADKGGSVLIDQARFISWKRLSRYYNTNIAREENEIIQQLLFNRLIKPTDPP